MRLFSTEAKVGVVIVAALAGLAWLTFQIGEFRFREKGYVIEAVFTTVSGLEDESKVRMAGVLVGTVDRIFLREGRAHALLRLDDGVVVREDSVVSVASIGILAERYVEITSGSQTARALPPGSLVQGRELVDLDQLVAQLSEGAESISALAESLTGTFGGEDSSLARLIENTDGLVERLSALLDENRRQVAQLLGESAALARETRALIADNRDELHGAIANLREFSATLDRRAGELSDQLTRTAEELRGSLRGGREDFQGLVASLRSAAGRAEAAADALTSVLKKVDEGRGTVGQLINDDRTLERVDGAIDRVDRAAVQFGEIAGKINAGQGSIGRLVTDDALVTKLESTVDSANRFLGESDRMHFFLGYRGEYLERSAEIKNYVTMKFQPRDDKYYLLELVDDPAGKRSITTTTTRIDHPDGSYDLTEHTETTEEGKLKFSVQFAKDFGALTFRGGLVESQGGAGIDYRLFGDRLRLSADGWDFTRDEGPHYKVAGRLRLFKDVFLNAGVDDVAEDDLRSVFVGAGILFSDEDLKYLLTLTRFSQ